MERREPGLLDVFIVAPVALAAGVLVAAHPLATLAIVLLVVAARRP